eukprot:g8129.t1
MNGAAEMRPQSAGEKGGAKARAKALAYAERKAAERVDGICRSYLDGGEPDAAQKLLDGLRKKYGEGGGAVLPRLLRGAEAATERARRVEAVAEQQRATAAKSQRISAAKEALALSKQRLQPDEGPDGVLAAIDTALAPAAAVLTRPAPATIAAIVVAQPSAPEEVVLSKMLAARLRAGGVHVLETRTLPDAVQLNAVWTILPLLLRVHRMCEHARGHAGVDDDEDEEADPSQDKNFGLGITAAFAAGRCPDWLMVLSPHTALRLAPLRRALAALDSRRAHFLGHRMTDSELLNATGYAGGRPVIHVVGRHHHEHAEQELGFPLLRAGVALSAGALRALCMRKRRSGRRWALSADGAWVVTASDDKTARIW